MRRLPFFIFLSAVAVLAGMLLLLRHSAAAVPLPTGPGKQVALFVALCDNEHQGIAPVPSAIGDGENPERNLYWGCGDAVPRLLRRAENKWKIQHVDDWLDKPEPVLRTIVCTRVDETLTLTAFAWRGDAMSECLRAFEKALVSGKYELVAFIGHNGLMDDELPMPDKPAASAADAMVLCCMSHEYFTPRLKAMGSRPVLMTRQFMYPAGQVFLHALDAWVNSPEDVQRIREAAGRVYAENQHISARAGVGIFQML